MAQKPDICRKYVWGTCNKYNRCKFRHELVFDEMVNILKFCHDYQNMTACSREDCSYLHATREEENHFLATGQMPRALAERHRAMAAGAPSGSNMYGPQPPPPPPPPPLQQIMPPPPPPPPPQRASAPRPQQRASAPQSQQRASGPQSQQRASAPQTTATVPQPPFPQQPLPSQQPQKELQQQICQGPSQYPSTSAAYPLTPTTRSLPAMFDASRPPPIFQPSDMSETTQGNKRKTTAPYEAAPQKSSKGDNQSQDLCDECVLRHQRMAQNKEEIDKLFMLEADQSLSYKKALEEFERQKNVLLLMINDSSRRSIDDFIEGVQPAVRNNQPVQNEADHVSAIPKTILRQLIDLLLGQTTVSRMENAQAAQVQPQAQIQPAVVYRNEEAALLQNLHMLSENQQVAVQAHDETRHHCVNTVSSHVVTTHSASSAEMLAVLQQQYQKGQELQVNHGQSRPNVEHAQNGYGTYSAIEGAALRGNFPVAGPSGVAQMRHPEHPTFPQYQPSMPPPPPPYTQAAYQPSTSVMPPQATAPHSSNMPPPQATPAPQQANTFNQYALYHQNVSSYYTASYK